LEDAGLKASIAGFTLEAINEGTKATLNADIINFVTSAFTIVNAN
jgi:hypothetical protein